MMEMATGKPPFYTQQLKELITMIVEQETPRLEGFSQDFNDLIGKLLEKDPLKRITWEELKKHTFWLGEDEFTKRVFPHQP